MKRGSSLRFIEWPMPQIFASVLGSLIVGSWVLIDAALAHLLGRVLHGLDDIHVPGTAAQISGDGLADLQLARILVALEQCARGHEHARGAESALQAVLLGET